MSTDNTAMERELGWEDVIQKESGDFITLPEGDYPFTVESYDRARHAGSERLPACHKAVLKIKIDAAEGTALITHNLFLHTITEGMLSAFFESIGQKKKGEPLRMNWQMVPGSTGRLKLGIRSYQKDGENRTINEIKKFYLKDTPKYTPGSF